MVVQSNDENADEENVDRSGEEIRLAEDLRNCSLNQKNAKRDNSDCVKESVCESKQDEEATKCVNGNEINDKESAVENEFQEENYENDLVEDTTKNDDHVNEEGLSDGSHDQILDSHDTDHKDVRYQGDADDDADYHSSSEDDDSDDDDGWITPGNIHQIKADYGISETQSRPTNIAVGCLTTDFAMQVM